MPDNRVRPLLCYPKISSLEKKTPSCTTTSERLKPTVLWIRGICGPCIRIQTHTFVCIYTFMYVCMHDR